MYTNVFTKLGLHNRDLIPYEGRNLLMFNDSTIHLCGAMELSVCVREGKDERIMNLYFLVIHCKIVYDFILGRSSLHR